MDSKLAKTLINETLFKPFKLDNFEKFLCELFNNPDIKIEDITQFMKKGYKEHINKIISLGSYRDEFGDVIGFYATELKKSSSRDKARTMQRNVIADMISTPPYRGAALVAFYEPNTMDWRFSYIKRGYEFKNGNLREKLTSPKRHSFLVGPNEPNHTCASQFKDLLTFENHISLEQIENAFSIENVTDEFFEEYKKLYLDLIKSLDNVIEKDSKIAIEFKSKKINSASFSKKLMGQLVFLYFLQKKGWLGVGENEKWGTGSKDFLNRLFKKEYIDYDNFFNDVLEPLFYEGFSYQDKNQKNHFDTFNFKVPFLNGGLFEPMNNYDWRNTDLVLNNDIFKNILKTFNLFNFTIKEDEPLEKEVAVDPEMLGKVFENLLENIERKSKGAYYTPREIVHYMCQQSLINYLDINTDINREDLKKFIENSDLAIESIYAHHKDEENKKYNPKKIMLKDSIQNNSRILDNLLKNVKIIDLAVGSGAFPVGMMNEIVKARQCLMLISNYNNFDVYDLKKETIENSLYCVDLDYSATDITKLRFWLSLVVDQENKETINALPNLDNHIMCGNSLVDTYNGNSLFNKDLIQNGQTTLTIKSSEIEFINLEKKKEEYFNEKDYNSKKELKNKIEDIKWNFIKESIKESKNKLTSEELIKFKKSNSKPFFIWELEFSEIFKGKNPGFDIAIGNPPYVKENTDRDAFNGVRDSPYYQGKMDLWYLFGCKALDLVKDNGLVSFIATNNWITSFGASKFRNKINDEATFKLFIDFGNYKVFESADIQTMIYLMEKNSTLDNYYFSYGKLLNDKINKEKLRTFLYSNNSNEWFEKFDVGFNRNENKNNYFNFIEKRKSILLDKIKENKEYLNEKEIVQGIVPNPDVINSRNIKKIDSSIIKKNNIKVNDSVFIIPKDYLTNLSSYEKNFLKPVYEPKNCTKYSFIENYNLQMIYLTVKNTNKNDINLIPNFIEHLKPYKSIMESRRENKNGKREYFHIHWEREESFFTENPKILCVRKCDVPTFVYTEKEAYVMLSFNIIKTDRFDLKYLTGLLNSKLIQFWLKYKGKMQGDNYQLDKEPLLKIPLIYNNKQIEKEIITNVNQILDMLKKNSEEDITHIEETINKLVYKLYSLTEEEIAIIESDLK